MQLLFKLSHFRISSTNSEVRTTPAKSSINNDTRCNMTWGVVGIRQSSRSWTCTLVKLGLTACSVVAQSDVGYSGSLFSLQCEQMVVVGSLLCSERFLSRYSGFSLLFVVGSVSLEFFIFPALSLHCSLSCSVSTSDMPSQPMTQERMAPNIDWNITLKMHQ